MSEKHFWYLQPLDPTTNGVIAQGLPEENACSQIECADGHWRDLWRCDYAHVAQLERAQESLRLSFNIYVQKGHHGGIRRWLFPKKKARPAAHVIRGETPNCPICSVCEHPITESHPDEIKIKGGKPICDDCYYEGLGELVERHPITSARVHRG